MTDRELLAQHARWMPALWVLIAVASAVGVWWFIARVAALAAGGE